MAVFSSRLTEKGQATIPKEVRDMLHLSGGDRVAWIVEKVPIVVSIRKATPIDLAFSQSVSSTLDEWDSPLDDDAYNDL